MMSATAFGIAVEISFCPVVWGRFFIRRSFCPVFGALGLIIFT